MKTSAHDYTTSVAYDEDRKRAFHNAAKRALRALACELSLADDSFDLRSNKAGPAVSGEVALHAEHLYVSVEQTSMGPAYGILIRSCNGRKNHRNHGNNKFAPISLLNDVPALAERIRNLNLARPMAGV